MGLRKVNARSLAYPSTRRMSLGLKMLSAPSWISQLRSRQHVRTESQLSFIFFFSVTPNQPENATADWEKLVGSVASYVQNHCAEGVLVQAVHTNTLRLEVAFRFSGQGRDGKFFQDSLRRRTVLKNLSGSPKDWTVDSKLYGQAEGLIDLMTG